jgi:hypothetical protein
VRTGSTNRGDPCSRDTPRSQARARPPWFPVDWWRNPFQVGVSVSSSGGASWTIDATVDDPTGTYPNPLLNSSPTGRTVTVFNSSQLCGSTQSGESSGGVTAQAFSIAQPIAAWRLTLNNSSLDRRDGYSAGSAIRRR